MGKSLPAVFNRSAAIDVKSQGQEQLPAMVRLHV